MSSKHVIPSLDTFQILGTVFKTFLAHCHDSRSHTKDSKEPFIEEIKHS